MTGDATDILLSDGRVVFNLDYEAELLEALLRVPGRRFDPQRQTWFAPLTEDAKRGVDQLIDNFPSLVYSDDVAKWLGRPRVPSSARRAVGPASPSLEGDSKPRRRRWVNAIGLVAGLGAVAGAAAGSNRERRSPMSGDRILGDGGNCTVYERPDGSRYVLDRQGRGGEARHGTRIFGPAKFDSRRLASGQWAGSRSGRG